MGEIVRMKNVTICFPHLWEKHAPPGTDGAAKYGAEFILDPIGNGAELAAIEAAFRKVVQGVGKTDLLQYLKHPAQTGDDMNRAAMSKGKTPRKEIAGKRVLRASDPTNAPPVVDQQMAPIGPAQAGNLFGGCIVNAVVDLYWSSNPTNPGVFCGLRGVQLVSNVGVERLGGSALTAEQMFEPVAGAPAPLSPAPSREPASWE